jgi:sulfate adenylyltransferase large subunit
MTARPDPRTFELDAFLQQQGRTSMLRFIACGSVDHGKSTLIGRLLYEAKFLFDDQMASLATESRKFGTQGKELDFSLLLDGLAAEREQKITIDVAYRFFNTERRKFIVADAPGHEQYTRNMATGASTADLALILVNAEAGLTRQTRRHSLIVSTLGVRHLVLAVNKMDLVGWSEQAFRSIEAEFRAFAEKLDVHEITCIPLSARDGDNVVNRSANMDWYRGPTLLEHLEQVEVGGDPERAPFRMPVQLVNRPTADFRGYSGLVASGDVYPGMPVRILPSQQTSYIDRIVTYGGDADRAAAGQSVTLTLADDVDVSRGDVIVEMERPATVTDHVSARVVWMGKDALQADRPYLFKLGTCTANATIQGALSVIDLETQASAPADRLMINDIGRCTIKLDRPIAVDLYADIKETGGFILIDPESYDTIAMGCVERDEPAAAQVLPWRTLPWRSRLGGLAHAIVSQRGAALPIASRTRSFAKAISWRAAGSLATFVLALAITGSTAIAGSLTTVEVVTKILFYYFHERLWSTVPWGRPSPQ